MGAWGIGLYSGDFAQDLRASVKAVARLPFASEKLLDLLRAAEPAAAHDAKDPDHTVFWLVTADQLSRRGIECRPARARALAIIDGGADLAAMAALGMDEKSLAKRRALLAELRARLAAPAPEKKRAVLKAPEKIVLEAGQVLAYPVNDKGRAINPCLAGTKWEHLDAWRAAGWSACAVAETGHVFEYLAWYRLFVIAAPLPSQPALSELLAPRRWLLREPGTLTARHLEKLHMTPLGRVTVDAARLDRLFPGRGAPLHCAVSDISIANNLHPRDIAPRSPPGYPLTSKIEALAEIT